MSLENRLKQLNRVAQLPPRPDIPEVPDNINAWIRGFSRFSLPKGYPRGGRATKNKKSTALAHRRALMKGGRTRKVKTH